MRQAAAQRRRDVRPRVHRGGVYPLLRAFTTVLTRDVIVATADRGHARRPVRRLRRLRRVRRGGAPLGRRAVRRARDAAAAGPRARPSCARGRRQSSARTASSSCPTTARARGRRSGRGTARRCPTSSSGPAARAPQTTGEENPAAAGEESWGYAGGALTELASGPGVAGRGRQARHPRRDVDDGDGDVLLGPEALGPATPAAERGQRRRGPRLGQLRARLPHPRDHPHAAGTHRRSSIPDLVPTPARASRHRLPARRLAGARPARPLRRPASSSWPPASCGAPTRWRRSAGTRAPRSPSTDSFPHCADIMVNSCGTRRRTRSRRSRSSWGRTAASAATRHAIPALSLGPARPRAGPARRRGGAPAAAPLARAPRPHGLRRRGASSPARTVQQQLRGSRRAPATPTSTTKGACDDRSPPAAPGPPRRGDRPDDVAPARTWTSTEGSSPICGSR